MSREVKRFNPHAHSSSYASPFSHCSGFSFGGNKNNNNNQSGNSSFGSGGSTFGSGGSGSSFGSGNTFGSGNNNNNMQQGGGMSQKQSFTNSFLGGFCGAVIGNMILPLLHIK